MDILGQIASTANPVASAFEARSSQMQQKRDMEDAKIAAQQQQRDNDMLKVFDFAGSGKTEEAMYLAKSKNLDVPQEIFQNADFAKGLATAGNFYGDDPVGAQKFSIAWMQTRDIPDFGQRVIKASQIAGKPIDPEDRKFQRELAMEQYKNQAKDAGRRQELFIDATKESLGGFTPTPDAGAIAVQSYDQYFGGQSGLNGYSPNFSGATGVNTIQLMAQERGVDPVLASAVFGAESSFGMDSRTSSAGAIGPMQVMPRTLSDPGFGVQPARDNSEQELARVGVEYLGAMLKRYNGDVDAALVAYNAGPDNADKWLRAGRDYSALPDPNQTQPYVQKIKGLMQGGQLQQVQTLPPNQVSPNLVQTLPPQQNERQSLLSRAIQFRPQPNLPQLESQPIAQQSLAQNQLPSGVPQGSIKVGTANGRPVYQAPNGERFIDDGNP